MNLLNVQEVRRWYYHFLSFTYILYIYFTIAASLRLAWVNNYLLYAKRSVLIKRIICIGDAEQRLDRNGLTIDCIRRLAADRKRWRNVTRRSCMIQSNDAVDELTQTNPFGWQSRHVTCIYLYCKSITWLPRSNQLKGKRHHTHCLVNEGEITEIA